MTTGYRLGLVSDLHAGSRYALVPPKWWPQSDSATPSRAWMEYLWQCWEHFCQNVPKLDVLVVNGDIIEGDTPSRRDALDAITDSFVVQGEMAERMLGMLLDRAKPREWWMTRGTSFHDGKYYETVEAVARNLKAEKWADHRWSGEVLEGRWRGLGLNVTHHQTMGTIYSGTAASREARFAVAAEALAKVNRADLIVRSHLHTKYIGCFDDKWVVSLPCWKITTPYAIKKMGFYRAAVSNDLGAVLVETDGTGRRILIDGKTFAYPAYRQTERNLGEADPAGESGRTSRGVAGRARRAKDRTQRGDRA